MKPQMAIRVLLIFLVIAIGGFDRHLAYYFPGEAKALVQGETIPGHGDLPVKSCDYHEDITIKPIFCSIPEPVEGSANNWLIFSSTIPLMSSHSVWQPPEETI